MKKAPEAFRTISEVAEILNTPQHVLRFWETKFYQIRPVKRAGGRRYYRPDDLALLNGIRILLQDRRQTIQAVQRLLQDKGVRHLQELGADLPEPGPGEIPEDEGDTLSPPVWASLPPATEPVPPPRPPIDLAPAAPPAPVPLPRPAPAPVVTPLRPAAARTPEPPPPPEPVEIEADPVARLPHDLRQLPRDALAGRRERVLGLVRRIDALLDRMSEASGAGRW